MEPVTNVKLKFSIFLFLDYRRHYIYRSKQMSPLSLVNIFIPIKRLETQITFFLSLLVIQELLVILLPITLALLFRPKIETMMQMTVTVQ